MKKVFGSLALIGTLLGPTAAFAQQGTSPVPMATPSNPNANCTPGIGATVQYDANYIYTCIATNTWSRVANGAWASPPLIPPATEIIDGSSNVWTLSGGVVFENGSPAGTSSGVILVAYKGGVIYQENAALNWWSWNGAAWVSTTDPLGVQALSSDGLVDSIGINTHFNYTNTPYYTAFSTVEPILGALGVRHIRDVTWSGSNSSLAALNTTYGIKFSIITGEPGNGLPANNSAATEVTNATTLGAAAYDEVEGNNEPDVQSDSTWQADTLANQEAMWAAFKANGTVSAIPFAGPSIVNPTANGIPSGILSYMNLINIHFYIETTTTYPEQAATNILGSPYGSSAYASSLPVIVTETGDYGSLASPSSNGQVDYATQASYLPREFMANYAAGIKRSYKYELLDNTAFGVNGTDYFGLVQTPQVESAYTPKPAYYTIQNLINLLTDPGAAFQPGSLSYTLSGNTSNNVQSVLLGKRDGSFILSLVQGVSTWNTSSYTEISPPSPNSVTITLAAGSGMGHYQTATLSTTSTPNAWSALTPISGNAITVSVTPSITLVRLAP